MPPPVSKDHASLGEAIRTLRAERGFSQEELAHRSGLDRSYMGAIERGERNVALTNLLRVAQALDTTGADLLARAEL